MFCFLAQRFFLCMSRQITLDLPSKVVQMHDMRAFSDTFSADDAMEDLIVDAERVHFRAHGPRLLAAARVLLDTLVPKSSEAESAIPNLLSAKWWHARSAVVHQEALETDDFAAPLRKQAMRCYDDTLETIPMRLGLQTTSSPLISKLHLERAVCGHKFWCSCCQGEL